MDVAINTENPEANGGFTQDLLHIELIGLANINPDQGALNLDAVSMVEPDVLGQEFANGLLSFQLRSYKDQTNPPAPTVDNAAPTLQSWTFGEDGATGLDKTAMVKPTDPIILNFSEPLDRDTVTGKVHLYKNEGGTQTEMDATVTVDGGAIVIRPAQLEHPTETGPSLEYQVSIDAGITDLSGEPWVESFDETFSLKTFADRRDSYAKGFTTAMPWRVAEADQAVPKKSPFLLAVYPGFPAL
ncbi:Ig-like domain-containing protein [Alcanivorax sp. IO_7]|nr:Ig-like domain-containing protein [Alcanivorax sp. IO_7]